MASLSEPRPPLPPPPPPPPTEEEEEQHQQLEDGTRVFGEGAAALSALSSWAASASKLPPLRSLDLRFSDEIDGEALSCLGAHARGLTSLRLDGCRNVVTSSSVPFSSSRGPASQKAEEEGDETQHSAPELAAVLARSSKTLRSLSLYWIPRLPSDVIYSAAAACEGLTSLNLSGCTRAVDDGALLALASSLGGGGSRSARSESGAGGGGGDSGERNGGGLRRLDLTRCQLLTDGGMAKAFAMMPKLQELRLYAVESFGDEAARALCESGGDEGTGDDKNEEAGTSRAFSKLEVLDVCGARDLSDAAATELVTKRCGDALRILGCGWVPNVGDELARALGRRCCRNLESLSLHGNRNLTEEGFDALVAGLSGQRKVKGLDVRGCVGVGEERRSREALREVLGEQLVEFALQR